MTVTEVRRGRGETALSANHGNETYINADGDGGNTLQGFLKQYQCFVRWRDYVPTNPKMADEAH